MEQTLSRRERKKLETRQGLLHAAQALFQEQGYRATTVEEITERADVSKGTFFNYFPSKDALLEELSLWRMGQLRAALDPDAGAPVSPVERIKLLIQLSQEHVLKDMPLFRRAFASRLSHPPPHPHQSKHRLYGLLTELVEEAQASGEIRADADIKLVSDLLHVVLFRRILACRGDIGEPSPPEYYDGIVDLLMDGLSGPNWRQE
jgi:AcrR family transcriptional regulator